MKKYYIYKQNYEILETQRKEFFSGFYFITVANKIKYTNFEFVGYLIGAQAIYDSLKNYICVDKYSYPTITIKGYAPQPRFLIIDEKERIRNFKELTKNCKKGKSRRKSWHPYQNRNSFKTKNELKQVLVKEDVELCLEYGVYIKPIRDKRKVLNSSWDWYDYERPSRKGRSWKEQSKRKHQWKNIKNF